MSHFGIFPFVVAVHSLQSNTACLIKGWICSLLGFWVKSSRSVNECFIDSEADVLPKSTGFLKTPLSLTHCMTLDCKQHVLTKKPRCAAFPLFDSSHLWVCMCATEGEIPSLFLFNTIPGTRHHIKARLRSREDGDFSWRELFFLKRQKICLHKHSHVQM